MIIAMRHRLAMSLVLLCLTGTLVAETATGERLIQVHNRAFGELLRPRNASKKDGAPLVLYPAQPWKCMTWAVRERAGGGVVLENLFSRKTFAAASAGRGPAAVEQVPLATEVWHWEELGDGAWKIIEPESGRVLTAEKTAAGLRVIVAPWTGADTQKWELRPAPEHLTM